MKKSIFLGSSALMGLLAAGFCTVPNNSFAQDATQQNGGSTVEIVTVTAEKREENIQDVPESVTVVQPEPLVSTGQVLLRDYYTQIPGLSVAPSFNATQELSIRGISTGGGNPTVGVLVDDAPYPQVNDIPDIDLEDLARVEVLKGPQGTLYGANSMGGLINYITADPSTSEIFGRVESGASLTDNGAEPGYDLRGSINLPISDDLAVRLSGFTRQDTGYIDNVRFNLRGINQTEASGVRLAVLWQPILPLTVRLSATYQDTQAPAGALINPSLGQYKIDLLPGADANTFRPQIYNARIVYDSGNVSLTSITSYSRNSYSELTDFSTIWGPAASQALKRNVGVIFDFKQNGIRGVSQEVRLASEESVFFQWMFGAFYYDQYFPNSWTMDGRDPTTDALVGRFWNYAQSTETQESAIFANAKFSLTDEFDVQFGARETRSVATSGANIESGPAIQPPDSLGVPYTPGESVAADQFTYLASPSYHITPDVMAYARVATGFRPVASNDPGSVALGAPKIVNPDTTTNYEVGLKGDFLDHALTIEAAAYWIDWQNIQIELIKSGFVYDGNGSGATSQGFELTAHAKLTESLTLDGWISYDDAKITRDFAQGQAGERLPFTPQFSAYGSAEQDFTLSSFWTAYVGGDIAYVGQRTGIFIGLGDPRQIYPAYTKVDLRIGARTDLWRVELYSTNIGNSHGQLNGGLGYVIPGVFIDIPPRTVGISVAREF